MNREAVMKAAGFLCIAYGENPSRRNIQRVIAETHGGKTFSTSEVNAFLKRAPWLVPDRYQLGTASVPNLTLKNGELVPSQDQESSLRAGGVKDLKSRAKPVPNGTAGAQSAMFETWQERLEAEISALSDRRIVDLEPAQLHVVGQMHALRFTRSRVNAQKNRQAGVSIAPAIKNVTKHEAFADLTVDEYLRYGKAIYDALPDARSGKEWRRPWDVTVYAS